MAHGRPARLMSGRSPGAGVGGRGRGREKEKGGWGVPGEPKKGTAARAAEGKQEEETHEEDANEAETK